MTPTTDADGALDGAYHAGLHTPKQWNLLRHDGHVWLVCDEALTDLGRLEPVCDALEAFLDTQEPFRADVSAARTL